MILQVNIFHFTLTAILFYINHKTSCFLTHEDKEVRCQQDTNHVIQLKNIKILSSQLTKNLIETQLKIHKFIRDVKFNLA